MIADYMFNKFTLPAGCRVCVMLSSAPMSAGALGDLTGKTVEDLRALESTLATAVPPVDVKSFGFRMERSATSAYGQHYVPAISLPSKCVYSPVRSGTVACVVFALLDGSAPAGKVLRCYQCTAGLSGAEAKLSRVTVSVEDIAFEAKLSTWGAIGDQIGETSATVTVVSPESSPTVMVTAMLGKVAVVAPTTEAGLISLRIAATVRVTPPTTGEP